MQVTDATPIEQGTRAPHGAERAAALEELVRALVRHEAGPYEDRLTAEQCRLLHDVLRVTARAAERAGAERAGAVRAGAQRAGRGRATASPPPADRATRISLPEVASSAGQAASLAATASHAPAVVVGGSVCRVVTYRFAEELMRALATGGVRHVELRDTAESVAAVLLEARDVRLEVTVRR